MKGALANVRAQARNSHDEGELMSTTELQLLISSIFAGAACFYVSYRWHLTSFLILGLIVLLPLWVLSVAPVFLFVCRFKQKSDPPDGAADSDNG